MKWQSMLQSKPISLASKYALKNNTYPLSPQPNIHTRHPHQHSIDTIQYKHTIQYLDQSIKTNQSNIDNCCSITLLKQNIRNDGIKNQLNPQVTNPSHNDQPFDRIQRQSGKFKQNTNRDKTKQQNNSLYYSQRTSIPDPVMDIHERQSISSLKNSLETYRFRVGYLDHQIKQRQFNEEILINTLKTKFEQQQSILNDKLNRLNNQVKEKDRIICQLLNRQA